MFKKAGIVVALASATVVGAAPLAFASDHDHHHHNDHHHVGLLGGVAEGVGGLLHGVGEALNPLLRGVL